MTNMTVSSMVFTPDKVSASVQGQRAAASSSSFGDVLDKASQKMEQPKTEQPKTSSTDNKTVSESNTAAQDKAAETKEVQNTEKPQETKEVQAEETVDEETAQKVADALMQLIEQLKEILGITDEELRIGLESADMQPMDLLNPQNMAQLLSAITGEDSIGIVANEDLYASLQEMIGSVENQLQSLTEETGLTSEELDLILQKLQELQGIEAGDETGTQIPNKALEMLNNPAEDMDMTYTKAAESAETTVIVEDKTKTESAKPSNQLEQSTQDNANNGTQTETQVQTDKSAEEKQAHSDTKNSGHQPNNFAQNMQNNLNELSEAAAETKVESYTSMDTESIMRQLANLVKIAKSEDLTQMEMQLHPASLGTVNVSLASKGGVVTAEFITQNEAVKNAVEAQAVQLRANLEEQGIKIEAIEVSVASHQMEKNLEGDNSQGQQQSEQEQKTNRIQGMRRNNINFHSFEDGDDILEEMQGADDATRIAMEMMAMHGNSMDLLA